MLAASLVAASLVAASLVEWAYSKCLDMSDLNFLKMAQINCDGSLWIQMPTGGVLILVTKYK